MNLPESKKAYVIGMDSIKEELVRVGLETNDSTHNSYECYQLGQADFQNLDIEIHMDEKLYGRYDVVVTGLDTQASTFKLNYASFLIQRGATWLATNPDLKNKTANGYLTMGGGSIWKSIESTLGKSPEVIGKPSNFCWEHLEQKFGIDKDKSLMIGDNAKTDIQFAKNGGVDSLLVLTGVTNVNNLAKEFENNSVNAEPTYIANNLNFV